MKKTIVFFFIALSLLITSAYALTIGEMWVKLDPLSKQFIIIGYKQGLKDGVAIAKEPDPMEPKEIAAIDAHEHIVAVNTYRNVYSTHLKEMVRGMDDFYTESSNRYIPIDYAILYVTQKQNGVSEQEAQKDLAVARTAILKATVLPK
jgi:hypothetical protein